jgi:hypothetical protein
MKKGFLKIPVICIVAAGFVFCIGCDLFENDGDDWENDVTIKVFNDSDCLVDFFIDGVNQTVLNPQDEFDKSDLNRGIHLLEAYPWNDAQFSCDRIYTDTMENGDVFEWVISNNGDCGQCLPTPTPIPETPTPTPTPEES